ncbi:hypothetical protein E2C01_008274 [Portunus trituberculatus]|uniref:Uncharacterized protein n=1 Tax=Portunus trituberculatus TaxID=210409 RepID=A0A5B7D2P7_PORTR|nr:hypothetical protein [Portunus trituberculatus]
MPLLPSSFMAYESDVIFSQTSTHIRVTFLTSLFLLHLYDGRAEIHTVSSTNINTPTAISNRNTSRTIAISTTSSTPSTIWTNTNTPTTISDRNTSTHAAITTNTRTSIAISNANTVYKL